MAKTEKSKARHGKTAAPPPPELSKADQQGWLDLVIEGMARFSRYGWDLLGICLLLVGVLVGFGLAGWTRGSLIDPLSSLVRQGFGWGSWLLILAALAGGGFAIIYQHRPAWRIPFGRILALEGAVLTIFPLLTLLGDGTLAHAQAGVDGGWVGWGLVEVFLEIGLSRPVLLAMVGILLLLFLLAGSGLVRSISAWADGMLAEGDQLGFPPPFEPAVPRTPRRAPPLEVEKPAGLLERKDSGSKKSPQIPAEFRKSLKPQPIEAEPQGPPPQRDERLPPLNLLTSEQNTRPDERIINQTAGLIEKSLAEFGVPARVIGYRVGPTVTQYAIEPGFIEKAGPDGSVIHQKVRVSQISALARDLTLALSAERLRIEAPVPGHSYVGIEVPNSRSAVVRLRSILESDLFYKVNSPLTIALGRDVSGRPVVVDLARMPHMLIAGTTGSGKSVCIAALAACLVINNTPEDLRLAMIDPKMVELVRFNGLPHVLGKVETELERILAVLRWTLAEMEHRYRLLESAHTRDILTYNRKMEKHNTPPLPRLVLIIDELADLMMSAPDETEHSIVRLAQMARAVGIHLVVATQRPSTDVVTGLIKANFPARIAFTVASSIDSRVILDSPGAETLLGKGDMLFLNPEVGAPSRAQGVLVTDQEIDKVIQFWAKMSPGQGEAKAPWEEMMNENGNGPDSLIEQAIAVIRGSQRASASLLQRRLRIGYPRAARLIDELEDMGVVGPSQGGGKEREVLIGSDEDGSEEDVDGLRE
jgi:S-DNA-T family DNA segregation ATPase FtsK/SpoIIIE